MLKVGLLVHLLCSREANPRTLNHDSRDVRILRIDVLPSECAVEVLLEEIDTLDGEADRARSVSGGGDPTLEGVAEGDEAGVEEVCSFFAEYIGDYFCGVGFGSVFGSEEGVREG